jgi:anti-sigma B factor antagonist
VDGDRHGVILRPLNSLIERRADRLQSRQEDAEMDVQISARKSENVTILDVRGRIVIGDGNDFFAAELQKLAARAPCNVLVNLVEVTQVDSSGISTLVKVFVTLKGEGGNLKILNPVGTVRRVLDVTGLLHCFPTYTDEETAIASFRDSAAHA